MPMKSGYMLSPQNYPLDSAEQYWADHRSPDIFPAENVDNDKQYLNFSDGDLKKDSALSSPDLTQNAHNEEAVQEKPRSGSGKGGKGRKKATAKTVDAADSTGASEKVTSATVIHHHPPKSNDDSLDPPVGKGGQTLLIAYFPWEASEDDVFAEFSRFCVVKKVHLVLDKNNTRPRCFGFVKFDTPEDARAALVATKAGKVTLKDSRDHIWHLKAEWAKTGDMVDDSWDTRKQRQSKILGSKGGAQVSGKGKGRKTIDCSSNRAAERAAQQFLMMQQIRQLSHAAGVSPHLAARVAAVQGSMMSGVGMYDAGVPVFPPYGMYCPPMMGYPDPVYGGANWG